MIFIGVIPSRFIIKRTCDGFTVYGADAKLYGIRETSYGFRTVPVVIGTCENISVIIGSIDVISFRFFFDDFQSVLHIICGDSDWYVSVILHLELEFEVTIFISSYNTISSIAIKPQNIWFARSQLDFSIDCWGAIFFVSIASDSHLIATICGKLNIVKIQKIQITCNIIRIKYYFLWRLTSRAIIIQSHMIHDCFLIYGNHSFTKQFTHIIDICHISWSGLCITSMQGIFATNFKRYLILCAACNRTIKCINKRLISCASNNFCFRGSTYFFYNQCASCFIGIIISCPDVQITNGILSTVTISIFQNKLCSEFIASIHISGSRNLIILNYTVAGSINLRRSAWYSSESSNWNEGQHECCHGSQRYNLLRDLIQLYSLPINFTRSFACPHSGAGVAVRPSLASCGTRRPLPPCTSTTASAVASGTGRIIPAWRYAVAVFPLPIT